MLLMPLSAVGLLVTTTSSYIALRAGKMHEDRASYPEGCARFSTTLVSDPMRSEWLYSLLAD
jgi:hypothetical protein